VATRSRGRFHRHRVAFDLPVAGREPRRPCTNRRGTRPARSSSGSDEARKRRAQVYWTSRYYGRRALLRPAQSAPVGVAIERLARPGVLAFAGHASVPAGGLGGRLGLWIGPRRARALGIEGTRTLGIDRALEAGRDEDDDAARHRADEPMGRIARSSNALGGADQRRQRSTKRATAVASRDHARERLGQVDALGQVAGERRRLDPRTHARLGIVLGARRQQLERFERAMIAATGRERLGRVEGLPARAAARGIEHAAAVSIASGPTTKETPSSIGAPEGAAGKRRADTLTRPNRRTKARHRSRPSRPTPRARTPAPELG
jgi:hypothetical protein